MVGVVGFEPTAALGPKPSALQAALHPELSTNTVDKKNFKVY